MKIFSHKKNIRRNTKIGQYASLASLVILGGGMWVSFSYPSLLYVSFLSLLVGFVLSQVGIYFGHRWGRSPRNDEMITSALKGLTKDYSLYHLLTPVSHLLVGPAGVWIIEPYYQRGTISYEKNKWKQSGGGLSLAYLKVFAQEGLGRPDIEVQNNIENLTKSFKKVLGEDGQMPAVKAVMVFSDNRVELQVNDSPIPAVKIDQLKEFLRKAAKQDPLSQAEITRICAVLPTEDIE